MVCSKGCISRFTRKISFPLRTTYQFLFCNLGKWCNGSDVVVFETKMQKNYEQNWLIGFYLSLVKKLGFLGFRVSELGV